MLAVQLSILDWALEREATTGPNNAKARNDPVVLAVGLQRLTSWSSSSSTSSNMFGPLGASFAPWIRSQPAVYKWFKPFANWYANIAGYRQLGLKYDDLRMCCLYGVGGDGLNRMCP